MAGGILAELGLDRYDRNARLRPALIVCLPVLLAVAVWLPDLWSFMGGLVSLVAACGALYLLSRYARYAGRRLERRMLRDAGGWNTTHMLRHRDDRLSAVTKERYHGALRARSLPMPSPAEELADPSQADACYASAADWLRGRTRGPEHKLLLDENIDYGFRRNLVGMRPLGITLCLLSLAGDGVLLFLKRNAHDARWTAGMALAVLFVGILLGWAFVLRRPFVEDASEAYAKRLLEHSDRLGA